MQTTLAPAHGSTLPVEGGDEALRAIVNLGVVMYPVHLLRQMAEAGIKIRILSPGERYCDASPYLKRMRVDVEKCGSSPRGLFAVVDRTVYLRETSRMVVTHELGHALDLARGGDAYRSGVDCVLRAAFRGATGYVTPIAALGIDEYWAEGCRAMLDDANDPRCPWPRATRERLRKVDPTMFKILAEIFKES